MGGIDRSVSLQLLRDFAVFVNGAHVTLRQESERLLAFLALASQPVRRNRVAGTLWPDVPDRLAAASLRSALWRLGEARPLVITERSTIALDPEVAVDLRDASTDAAALVAGDRADVRLDIAIVDTLAADLLPGWYDDWVVVEAERWRLHRMRALDALASRLLGERRYDDALIAGLAAAHVEPMHERAHAVIVEAERALGNLAEAQAHYEQYRTMLWHELHLEPSERLRDLVADPSRGDAVVTLA